MARTIDKNQQLVDKNIWYSFENRKLIKENTELKLEIENLKRENKRHKDYADWARSFRKDYERANKRHKFYPDKLTKAILRLAEYLALNIDVVKVSHEAEVEKQNRKVQIR
jgi:hypothetical protein